MNDETQQHGCWHQLDFGVRRKDRTLALCYGVGFGLGCACLFLPYRLSQIGAVVFLVALLHMICRLGSAYRASLAPSLAWPERLRFRLALVESVLFNVPFLVGANLVFMGIPLSADRLQEAILDCAFLAATVLSLGGSYWWNQRVMRTFAQDFCVVSKAIQPPGLENRSCSLTR